VEWVGLIQGNGSQARDAYRIEGQRDILILKGDEVSIFIQDYLRLQGDCYLIC
jgi:hypothetical protein